MNKIKQLISEALEKLDEGKILATHKGEDAHGIPKPNPSHPAYAKHKADYEAKKATVFSLKNADKAHAAKPKVAEENPVKMHHIEAAISNSFPDVEPYEHLARQFPHLHKATGKFGSKLTDLADKTVRANSKHKSLSDYSDAAYKEMHSDKMMGESEELDEAKADSMGAWIVHKDGKLVKKFKTREGAKKFMQDKPDHKLNSAEGFYDKKYESVEESEELDEGYGMDDIAVGGTVIYKSLDGTHKMSKVRKKGNGFTLHLMNGSTIQNHAVKSTDASDWNQFRDLKESVEELDESAALRRLSVFNNPNHPTYGRYAGLAKKAAEVIKSGDKEAMKKMHASVEDDPGYGDAHYEISGALKHAIRESEESEELSELDKETLQKYKLKSQKAAKTADVEGDYSTKMKRLAGVAKVVKRQLNDEIEESEELDESGNQTPIVRAEKYSWGTMKHITVGKSFSIPLHPKHHEAIEKLNDQEEHRFTDETNARWDVKRHGDMLHFKGFGSARGNNTKVPLSYLKSKNESVEELDEVKSDVVTTYDKEKTTHTAKTKQGRTSLYKQVAQSQKQPEKNQWTVKESNDFFGDVLAAAKKINSNARAVTPEQKMKEREELDAKRKKEADAKPKSTKASDVEFEPNKGYGVRGRYYGD